MNPAALQNWSLSDGLDVQVSDVFPDRKGLFWHKFNAGPDP